MLVHHHQDLKPVPRQVLKQAEKAAVQARAELDRFTASEQSLEDYQKITASFPTLNFLAFCGGPILGIYFASKIQTGPAAWITLAAGVIGTPALSIYLAKKGGREEAQKLFDQEQARKQVLVQNEEQARIHRDQLYQQDLSFLKSQGVVDGIDLKQDEDYLLVGDQLLPRQY